MLPFLKNKDEGGDSNPIKHISMSDREDDSDFGMLDAIAEDLMQAISTKNIKQLKSVLEALCEHIQEQDEQQDQGME